jgi:hypothetical protein
MVRQRTGSTVASVAMQTQPADSAQANVGGHPLGERWLGIEQHPLG